MTTSTARNPVGMQFMEPLPGSPLAGQYSEEQHMWLGVDRQPVLLMSGTATGSNASTGAAQETDYNEDFD